MTPKLFKFILLSFFILGSSRSNSQLNLGEKIKNKVKERVEQKTDQGIDKGLDEIENGVKEAAKEESTDKSNGNESSDESTSSEGKNSKSKGSGQANSSKAQASIQSFTKYDFVPGDDMLLFEDFSQDEVGDFPALWTTNGSGEVRTLSNASGKWLYMNSKDNVYCLMKDLTLPDNFILEFDVIPTPEEESSDVSSFTVSLYQGEGDFQTSDLFPGTGGVHINCSYEGWNVQGYTEGGGNMTDGHTEMAPIEINTVNHMIVWVQKRRLRVYHKGQKALDLPTVLYDGIKYNRLRFSLWSQSGYPFITNIRLTSAKPDMRSKLLTEGKLVSYGIYFDVNSDKVKPESYGTLKEIAQVLSENTTARVRIVGHTDGDGDEVKNLDLSKRRAISVKNELVKIFGIDSSRIETDGKGESVPVAPNDIPGNKAKNRRVEFIKL